MLGFSYAEILPKTDDRNVPILEGKINIPSDLGIVVNSITELTSIMYPDIINIKEKPTELRVSERANSKE